VRPKSEFDLLVESGLFHLVAERAEGREFRVEGNPAVDFCQTNYLGLDFHPRFLEEAGKTFRAWGSLTPTSRMEIDPVIFPKIEERIANLLGAEQVHLGSTITQLGFSLIPGIVEKGTIFADSKLHTVVYEACRLARDHGARIVRFEHQNLRDLEQRLKECKEPGPKLIAVDGVYSISTEMSDLPALQRLCEEFDAFLYVDDAHGFGIFGEAPSVEHPWGTGGGGVVRHLGTGYTRTFYASSFGKAFCTQGAFITIPSGFKRDVKTFSMHYLFSAPLPPVQVGFLNAVLDLNESIGEDLRSGLFEKTRRFVQNLQSLDIDCINERFHPVVYVPVGRIEDLLRVGALFKEAGIMPGLRSHPVVPPDQCGFRFAVSSLHTREQLDRAIGVFREHRREFRTARPRS